MPKYLDDAGVKYLCGKLKEMIGGDGQSNKVVNLTNIPIDKNIVFATINNNNSLSLNGIPIDGNEIHVLIKNTSASTITISLPTMSPYVLCTNEDVINLLPNKIAEVNLLSNGSEIYIRAL